MMPTWSFRIERTRFHCLLGPYLLRGSVVLPPWNRLVSLKSTLIYVNLEHFRLHHDFKNLHYCVRWHPFPKKMNYSVLGYWSVLFLKESPDVSPSLFHRSRVTAGHRH